MDYENIRQVDDTYTLIENELAFLDLLLEKGEVDSTILTNDPDLQQHIQKQPLLEWKAINVRRHKGLS